MRIGLGLPGLWLRRERGDMRVKRRRTGEGEGTDSESSSIFNRSGSGGSDRGAEGGDVGAGHTP